MPPASIRLLLAIVAASVVLGACGPDPDRLHDAAKQGDIERLRALLAEGGDVGAVDATGATPLVQALLHKRSAAAVVLLDAGADADAACRLEPKSLAEFVRLDDEHPVRITPLMAAAMAGDLAGIEALLDRGASIALGGEADITALHAAATAGRIESVRLLLDRGAPVDEVTQQGETALDYALRAGHREVAQLLRQHGSRIASPTIDVAGHYTIAAAGAGESLGAPWDWGAVPVGIAAGRDGSIYWAEYRSGAIRRLDREARDAATVAVVDGPLGLAFDLSRDTLYFVTDRHYPRTVSKLEPGTGPQKLFHGTGVNRPFAIAIAAETSRLYWSESINGRIRSSDLYGEGFATVYDDGIASKNERVGAVAMSSAGVAVDPARGFVFWTELLQPAIVRARLDGSELQTLLAGDRGLQSPTALAVDHAAAKLYWADPGVESILRADLDGAGVEVVANAADGVIEPYGLAIDAERRLLYWTDIARNGIWRTPLDRKQVERVIDLDAAVAAPPPAAGDADACAAAAMSGRQAFLRRWLKGVRTCLVKVAALKAVRRRKSDVARAAPTCARELRAGAAEGAFRAALASHCDAREIDAAVDAALRLGAEIVARDLPRAAEWLYDVRPFVAGAALPDHADVGASLAAIDDLLGRFAGAAPPSAPVADWTLPASGQTTTYGSVTGASDGSPVPVADDGAVRAGGALAYVDNGDGTVSDPASGLMWEKKCDGGDGLHDMNASYRWEAADGEKSVGDWLEAVNAEGDAGFAGYDDWRLPTLVELLGIVDYERFNPAVGTSFDAPGCGLGCRSVLESGCSCTRADAHWTATPFPAAEDHAAAQTVVVFHLGLVWERVRTAPAFVRAVRGPARSDYGRFTDNGDGTITDRRTRLVWEKKCACDDELHRAGLRMRWSYDGEQATLWDWLDAVNREDGRGFAGHDDWRIPNVKELTTLIDSTRMEPSIFAAFREGECGELASPRCGWTEPEMHWTSTTFADFPAHALAVDFAVGSVDDRVKTASLAVRAVRGPLPTSAIVGARRGEAPVQATGHLSGFEAEQRADAAQ